MQTIDSSKAAENVTGSDGAIHIPSNPTLAGLASLTRNVAYKTGADDLVMDIIAPQSTGDDDNRRYPTVVFVQGSAWTTPLVLVDGAEHEYDFWSQQVFDVIFDFIRERS